MPYARNTVLFIEHQLSAMLLFYTFYSYISYRQVKLSSIINALITVANRTWCH